MAVITDAKRRTPLIDGRNMLCPRCRRKNDILRYVPMGMIDEFADETNPIYKCPECRWIFSPALTPDELMAAFGFFAEQARSSLAQSMTAQHEAQTKRQDND